jgi:hypothetical protein
MEKLQIRNIRMYNDQWYSIKFSGPNALFTAMTQLLYGYSSKEAYRCEGAWIVRRDILERHADRFDNFESRAMVARETHERKA